MEKRNHLLPVLTVSLVGFLALGEGPQSGGQAALIEKGRQVYQDFECYNCHKIAGEGQKKKKGPVLDNIGNLTTADELKNKLLDPAVWYAEGYEREFKKGVMPDDYRNKMTEEEMDALVAYMATLRNAEVDTPKPVVPSGP